MNIENYRSGRLYDYLPDVLIDKGNEFKPYVHDQALPQTVLIAKLKQDGYEVRKIKVLSKKLRGVTDLHGKLYQPHEWLFVRQKSQES